MSKILAKQSVTGPEGLLKHALRLRDTLENQIEPREADQILVPSLATPDLATEKKKLSTQFWKIAA